MRVAFGVTALANGLVGPGVDGIGSVTWELITRIRSFDGLEIVPFEFARRPSGAIPGSVPAGAFEPQGLLALLTGAPFLRMRRALQSRVDLVHATDHFVPRLRGVPVLATLMDAIPLAHPEWGAYRFRALKNEAWRRSAHWADHVLTISDFSRQEIARWFKLPETGISVIPLGVDARWFVSPADSERQRVREVYALPERFFVFVGTLQPRKNLECVVRAHQGLPQALRKACPLIVVGRRGWGCDALAARLQAGDDPGVRWLQYLPGADLQTVVGLATALVFPSLYEGFGLPVLEAFAAGTPVIAANGTSIPEVAGNAAVLLDPLDHRAWRDAMHAMLHDEAMAQEYHQRGLARAAMFTWDRTAEALVGLYDQVAGA